MKTNVTWIYSASQFASVGGAQGFIVGFIFVFSRANGNYSGQFEPARTSIAWTRRNLLTGFAPYGALTRKRLKSKWGSITVNGPRLEL